ncbi:YVTN family beta-propeller repeat protein, partial [Methylobacterium sp. A54F]
SNERDNTVSVIDTATFEVTRTFPVGRRPRGLVFSRDGSRLFLCASDSDAVQVIDPASGRLLHDLPSGEDPEQFALAPDGRTLFI